jgi:multisubunit Na+/H+ antiporter MnhB subunit
MRVAMLLIAVSQTLLAVVFGVEWVRDQRRPASQRSFGRHRQVFVVGGGVLAVAAFVMAFAFND